MTARRGFYDVSIDGGAVGVHTLRGGFIRPRDIVYVTVVVQMTTLAYGAGVTIDVGWVTVPNGLAAAMDPSIADPAPSVLDQVYGGIIPGLAGWESMVLRVNNAALTAGSIEVLLEIDSL
jgi:hypothetical protein